MQHVWRENGARKPNAQPLYSPKNRLLLLLPLHPPENHLRHQNPIRQTRNQRVQNEAPAAVAPAVPPRNNPPKNKETILSPAPLTNPVLCIRAPTPLHLAHAQIAVTTILIVLWLKALPLAMSLNPHLAPSREQNREEIAGLRLVETTTLLLHQSNTEPRGIRMLRAMLLPAQTEVVEEVVAVVGDMRESEVVVNKRKRAGM
jgi:hypothetical protein